MITFSDINNHDEKLSQDDNFLNENEQNRVILEDLLRNTERKFNDVLLEITKKIEKSLDYEIKIIWPRDKSTYAGIKYDGNYSIKISMPFTRKIFVYSDFIAEKYENFWRDKLKIQVSKSEVRDMLFCSYCLIILCHEAAHILNGHLDFLKDKKIITTTETLEIDYLEILTKENSKENLEELEKAHKNNRDIWFALEAEADAFAAQSAVNLFRLIDKIWNVIERVKGIESDIVIAYEVYGYILATLFHFYDLISSPNDVRHPKPFVRMYISASSFNQLVKIKKCSSDEYKVILETLLKSYWEVSDNFKFYDTTELQKIKMEYPLEAADFMKKIPNILKKINISSYRKR
ncbi:MAG: hypothetical protein Q4D82_02590 [Neisseria sp.]|nr:hypothetical protein [Neisseria sp.]